ncbi:hypothetical protein EMIHUDRAFT_308811 [Emiliania huxleyi CCMP1516]|uniref:Tryptophan synthase beta chain-like PALP domain-containing protein n=2 Tax=Emiliania huxleyi TaxID=2903 RepID=A0A0D3IE22_EMIH1|nr:hypothetical protein EMIHUDRAFT_308811 [Emiliania huxleyi CCMP1516]EOD09507.1 hypothetical protein EMIHUDRAFT_308811 [Emiliania huxleyi CCMP1516]|eukprot:XP_005761936.1 hypothetical protein EMIHUDRAFT_308811 [Emiliania huxleyi CCMP1516]
MTISSVRVAADRLRAVGARPTPVLRSDWVDATAGCACYLKAEHLQRTGSFKQPRRGSRRRGRRARRERGVPCCVVVPRTTPGAKIDNMRRYGARVVLCEPTQSARSETAAAEAAAMGGAAFVHPYDDAAVLAGQGTIGLELAEELPQLDAVLVPVSGGGMVGGIAVALHALRPGVRVIAVEPKGKGLGRCLALSQRVLDPEAANGALDTIADAIRTKCLGPTPWAAASQLLDPAVLSVDDDQIRAAMRIALLELKQVVEPAGALTLAALLSPAFKQLREACAAHARAQHEHQLRHVAAIVCGGNIDLETLFLHVRTGP